MPEEQNKFSKKLPQKRLKIAVCLDSWFPFVGGAQIHVQAIQKEFRKTKVADYSIYAPSIVHLWYRFFWTIVIPIRIAVQHRQKQFDVIHSHGFHSGLSAKIASVLINRPVIHTVHGSHLIDKQEKTLMAKIEAWLLLKIDYSAMITVAQDFKRYQPKTKRIFHITNGVDVAVFDRIKPIKHTDFRVLFIGRNHPDKGLDILHQAINQLQDTSIRLVSIVDGNLTGNDLIKMYKSVDVFVLPSRAEGQPITILEAWAAKLPVIATPVGENKHMIKHNQNGLLVPVDDPDRLSQSIATLKNNQKLAKKLGNTGHVLVTKRYHWTAIAKQTYQVYQQVIQDETNI